jgi:hypothetical protein
MNTTRVLTPKHYLRRMKGGSQPHLIRATDGRAYVVKCHDNPQGGRRVLINEYLGTRLLQLLGVAVPSLAFINLGKDFINGTPSLRFLGRDGDREISPGVHLASLYIGLHPKVEVYDSLPTALLRDIHNRADFLGALVADKWMSNADARQTLFFYSRWSRFHSSASWQVRMIDQGLEFQGTQWMFRDSPIQAVYRQTVVYGQQPTLAKFLPWIDRALTISRGCIKSISDELPPSWVCGDECALSGLLERLYARRLRLADVVQNSVEVMTRLKEPRVIAAFNARAE